LERGADLGGQIWALGFSPSPLLLWLEELSSARAAVSA
jgi:hypothetical protein